MTKMIVAGDGHVKVYDLTTRSLEMCLQATLHAEYVPAITIQWPVYYVERFGYGHVTIFVAC